MKIVEWLNSRVKDFNLWKSIRKGLRAGLLTYAACLYQQLPQNLCIILALTALLAGSTLNLGEFLTRRTDAKL